MQRWHCRRTLMTESRSRYQIRMASDFGTGSALPCFPIDCLPVKIYCGVPILGSMGIFTGYLFRVMYVRHLAGLELQRREAEQSAERIKAANVRKDAAQKVLSDCAKTQYYARTVQNSRYQRNVTSRSLRTRCSDCAASVIHQLCCVHQ